MNTILSIRIQKLFLLAVILKVLSAFLGWSLQLQWSLGLALPLLVMSAYIVIGVNRKDREVTDEKFADSCYYLGFIFTITSIVFSLFDLPNIGEHIQDIAVRFGAAMVSTVFGLAVRVYLVSFKPDSSDALKDAEDAVLDAAKKFREQLVMAYEKLVDFQGQVSSAAQSSVEMVKLQVEKLTEDHSARMERVFVELNERNQQAVTQALSEVSAASSRMAWSIGDYADGMKASMQSLSERVDTFGEALTQRLKTTTFPDDYFVSRLAEPLDQLSGAASDVAKQVQSTASGASEAANVLSVAIRKLKTKATQAEESLDTIVRLTNAQHSILDNSAAQLEQFNKLGELLSEVQRVMLATTTAISASTTSNTEVQARATEVLAAVEASQREIIEVMTEVSSRLHAEREATGSLVMQVQSAEAATKELAQELRGNSTVAMRLTAKLEEDSSAKSKLIAVIDDLHERQESISKAFSIIDNKASDVSADVNDLATSDSAQSSSTHPPVSASAGHAIPVQPLPDTSLRSGNSDLSLSHYSGLTPNSLSGDKQE